MAKEFVSEEKDTSSPPAATVAPDVEWATEINMSNSTSSAKGPMPPLTTKIPDLTTEPTSEEGTTISEETPTSSESGEKTSPSSSESSEETSSSSSESTESRFNEVDTTTSSVHVTFGSENSPHTYLPPVMSLLSTQPMSADVDKTTPSILLPPFVDHETTEHGVTTPSSPEPSPTEPTTPVDTVEHKFSGTTPPADVESPTETHPSGSGEVTEASSTQNVPSSEDSTKKTAVEITTLPDEPTKSSPSVDNAIATLPPQTVDEVTKSSEETTPASDSTEDFHESHETHEMTTLAEGMTVPVVNELPTEKKDEESTTVATREETPKPDVAGTTPKSDESAETPDIEKMLTTESSGGETEISSEKIPSSPASKEATTPGDGETVTESTSPSTDDEPKATDEPNVTETTSKITTSTGTAITKSTNKTQSPADCAAISQEINVKNPRNKTIVLVTGTNRLKPKTPNRQPVSCLRNSDCSSEEICKNNICTLKYVAHGMSSAKRPDLFKGIIFIKLRTRFPMRLWP